MYEDLTGAKLHNALEYIIEALSESHDEYDTSFISPSLLDNDARKQLMIYYI